MYFGFIELSAPRTVQIFIPQCSLPLREPDGLDDLMTSTQTLLLRPFIPV